MAMPNITKLVVLNTLYDGIKKYSYDIKKELEREKLYRISDGLLSTVLKNLGEKGYIKTNQKYSRSKGVMRLQVHITPTGREYYEHLLEKYYDEINRINRALGIDNQFLKESNIDYSPL